MMFIVSMISSRLRERRIKRAVEALVPRVKQHFEVGHRYNVFLSHGQTFEQVLFVGISAPYSSRHSALPFPLTSWVILEQKSGQRLYIKPESIRYYEDARNGADK
ncbi:MAG: hypothetical protein JO117_02955 [Verrucomicrobia bacterium]|nr:hypothetical protein [Verrucomicrobiota bacterium]MBV9659362.1 hypothetical protein [Verrucomicrobiota bacterium]